MYGDLYTKTSNVTLRKCFEMFFLVCIKSSKVSIIVASSGTTTQSNTLSRRVFCTSECSQHDFRCQVLSNYFLLKMPLDFCFGSSCLTLIRPCRKTTELYWPDFWSYVFRWRSHMFWQNI